MNSESLEVSYITSHNGNFADLRKSMLSVYKDLQAIPDVKYEHLVCLDGYTKYNCPDNILNIPNTRFVFNEINNIKAHEEGYYA